MKKEIKNKQIKTIIAENWQNYYLYCMYVPMCDCICCTQNKTKIIIFMRKILHARISSLLLLSMQNIRKTSNFEPIEEAK